MKDKSLCLAGITFTISSLTIPLMSVFTREKNLVVSTLLAVTFWVMLIAGIIFTVLFAKANRPLAKSRARAFLPFQTKATRLIDSLLIISLATTVVVIIGKLNVNWLQIVLLFLDLYLLELHFLFNLKGSQK